MKMLWLDFLCDSASRIIRGLKIWGPWGSHNWYVIIYIYIYLLRLSYIISNHLYSVTSNAIATLEKSRGFKQWGKRMGPPDPHLLHNQKDTYTTWPPQIAKLINIAWWILWFKRCVTTVKRVHKPTKITQGAHLFFLCVFCLAGI